jgi:hypothetical protein
VVPSSLRLPSLMQFPTHQLRRWSPMRNNGAQLARRWCASCHFVDRDKKQVLLFTLGLECACGHDRRMMMRVIALSKESGGAGEYPYGVLICRSREVLAESINRVKHDSEVTRMLAGLRYTCCDPVRRFAVVGATDTIWDRSCKKPDFASFEHQRHEFVHGGRANAGSAHQRISNQPKFVRRAYSVRAQASLRLAPAGFGGGATNCAKLSRIRGSCWPNVRGAPKGSGSGR